MINIDGQKIYGTEVGYERFIKSAIWRDMLAEIDVWKQMAESEYRTATSMEDVARIQGRAEAIDELRRLPHRLHDALVAINKNYSKETEDG